MRNFCRTGLVSLSLVVGSTSFAQFYPDSSGTWCILDLNNSTSVNITMEMRTSQDTLLNGRVYKFIDEYHSDVWSDPEYVGTYYVRSDTSGKGYIYLTDVMEEYLTGDMNAVEGDTLENVYHAMSGAAFEYSVVVDSVVELTRNNYTVRRWYAKYLGNPSGFNPMVFFWQSGMGCSYGAYMRHDQFQELSCVVADGHYAYSSSIPGNDATQLPAVSCECASITTGVSESLEQIHPLVAPNPSNGQFLLNNSKKASTISVYSATGQQVWQGTGTTIDLTAQPPGVYTAVVDAERGRQAVRLLVIR